MNAEIFTTRDGSHTILLPELNVTYHSRFGALNESLHVFIRNGLELAKEKFGHCIHILETGFGTGLNALLTLKAAEEKHLQIHYESIEKFPLETDMIRQLNYPVLTGTSPQIYHQLHECEWNKEVKISDHFSLVKHHSDMAHFASDKKFHCIYFDAFAPSAQSELWERSVLTNMNHALAEGGILVTFCAKGEFKRNLKASGFQVERVPGPPGKREMTRAIKHSQLSNGK